MSKFADVESISVENCLEQNLYCRDGLSSLVVFDKQGGRGTCPSPL
jgi:hypothetical protein